MIWLFKEEPRNYNFNTLEADRSTCWSGVRNPLAQKHLREVRKDDRILYYHTGRERAIVGMARAITAAYPETDDPTGRRVAVDIAPTGRLARPVTLDELRAAAAFASSPLLRIPRLSVLPITAAQLRAVEQLSRRPLPPLQARRSAGRRGRMPDNASKIAPRD